MHPRYIGPCEHLDHVEYFDADNDGTLAAMEAAEDWWGMLEEFRRRILKLDADCGPVLNRTERIAKANSYVGNTVRVKDKKGEEFDALVICVDEIEGDAGAASVRLLRECPGNNGNVQNFQLFLGDFFGPTVH